MPPEIHLLRRKKEKYDGKKADIFSLGVLLFNMVFLGYPFKEAIESDERYCFFYNCQFEDFWNLHQNRIDDLEEETSSLVGDIKILL